MSHCVNERQSQSEFMPGRNEPSNVCMILPAFEAGERGICEDVSIPENVLVRVSVACQTISLASELAEDIVASAVTDVWNPEPKMSTATYGDVETIWQGWKLLPPPLPDLSQPSVQARSRRRGAMHMPASASMQWFRRGSLKK